MNRQKVVQLVMIRQFVGLQILQGQEREAWWYLILSMAMKVFLLVT